MGRIKTALIKRVTQELLEKYKEDFSPEFEKNKLVVSSHTDVSSKKIRNIIAGYMSRLVKANKE